MIKRIKIDADEVPKLINQRKMSFMDLTLKFEATPSHKKDSGLANITAIVEGGEQRIEQFLEKVELH